MMINEQFSCSISVFPFLLCFCTLLGSSTSKIQIGSLYIVKSVDTMRCWFNPLLCLVLHIPIAECNFNLFTRSHSYTNMFTLLHLHDKTDIVVQRYYEGLLTFQVLKILIDTPTNGRSSLPVKYFDQFFLALSPKCLNCFYHITFLVRFNTKSFVLLYLCLFIILTVHHHDRSLCPSTQRYS